MAVPVADADRRRPAALLAGGGALGGGARRRRPASSCCACGRGPACGTWSGPRGEPGHPGPGYAPELSGSAARSTVTDRRDRPAIPAGCRRSAPKELRDDQRHPDPGPHPRAAPRRPGPAAAPTPRAALALLRQAAEGLAEAHRRPEPLLRYPAAYLAALRAGAAVLALRARPAPRRRGSRSVWQLLGDVAPELAEWAAYFASCSATRAAAEAGIERLVSTPRRRRPAAPGRAVPRAGHRAGRGALSAGAGQIAATGASCGRHGVACAIAAICASRRRVGSGADGRGGRRRGGRPAAPGPAAW